MMDCGYIRQNDLHERYVLERLEGSELTEYEEHIDSCEACRAELETEKSLIGAIRDIGREDMKDEIRRQVADRASARRAVNWTKLSKIAAAIVFLVAAPTLIYHLQREDQRLETVRLRDRPLELTTEGIEAPEGEKKEVAPPAPETPTAPGREVWGDTDSAKEKRAPSARDEIAPPDEITESQSEDFERPATRSFRAAEKSSDAGETSYFSLNTENSRSPVKPGESQPPSWRFVSDGKIIQVYFTGSSADAEEHLPDSFDIAVVRKDPSYLEMSAAAGSSVFGNMSAESRIDFLPHDTMHLVLNDTIAYIVDLTDEKPRAVLAPRDR